MGRIITLSMAVLMTIGAAASIGSAATAQAQPQAGAQPQAPGQPQAWPVQRQTPTTLNPIGFNPVFSPNNPNPTFGPGSNYTLLGV
jgi:hypothetical protein